MASSGNRPILLPWILVCVCICCLGYGGCNTISVQQEVTTQYGVSQETDISTSTGTTSESSPPSPTLRTSQPDDSSDGGMHWTVMTIVFAAGCLALIVIVFLGGIYTCRMKRKLKRYKVINYTTHESPHSYDQLQMNDQFHMTDGGHDNAVVLTNLKITEDEIPGQYAPKPPDTVLLRPAPSTPDDNLEMSMKKVMGPIMKKYCTSIEEEENEDGDDKGYTNEGKDSSDTIPAPTLPSRSRPPVSKPTQKVTSTTAKHVKHPSTKQLQKIPSTESEEGVYETYDHDNQHLRRDISYLSDITQEDLAVNAYEEPVSRFQKEMSRDKKSGHQASGLPDQDLNMYEPIDSEAIMEIRRSSAQLELQRSMSGLPDDTETGDSSAIYDNELSADQSVTMIKPISSDDESGIVNQLSFDKINALTEDAENLESEQRLYGNSDVIAKENSFSKDSNTVPENLSSMKDISFSDYEEEEEELGLYDDGDVRMADDPIRSSPAATTLNSTNDSDDHSVLYSTPKKAEKSKFITVDFSKTDINTRPGMDVDNSSEPGLYEDIDSQLNALQDKSEDIVPLSNADWSATTGRGKEEPPPPLPSVPPPELRNPLSSLSITPKPRESPSPPPALPVTAPPEFPDTVPPELPITSPPELPDVNPPSFFLMPPTMSPRSQSESPVSFDEPDFPPPPGPPMDFVVDPSPDIGTGFPAKPFDSDNIYINNPAEYSKGDRAHSGNQNPAPENNMAFGSPPKVPARRFQFDGKDRSFSIDSTDSSVGVMKPDGRMNKLPPSAEALARRSYFMDKEEFQPEITENVAAVSTSSDLSLNDQYSPPSSDTDVLGNQQQIGNREDLSNGFGENDLDVIHRVIPNLSKQKEMPMNGGTWINFGGETDS